MGSPTCGRPSACSSDDLAYRLPPAFCAHRRDSRNACRPGQCAEHVRPKPSYTVYPALSDQTGRPLRGAREAVASRPISRTRRVFSIDRFAVAPILRTHGYGLCHVSHFMCGGFRVSSSAGRLCRATRSRSTYSQGQQPAQGPPGVGPPTANRRGQIRGWGRRVGTNQSVGPSPDTIAGPFDGFRSTRDRR
jgi:hypothetical protein